MSYWISSRPSIWRECILPVVLGIFLSGPAQAATNYVSLSGTGVYPFSNWSNAAVNIQNAIDVAMPGDIVLVSNGTYQVGFRTPPGDTRCRIVVTSNITVRSLNGSDVTIIEGNPSSTDPMRCAYILSGAKLSGFTLRNGMTQNLPYDDKSRNGAGAVCDGGTMEECSVYGNWAMGNGGGVYSVNSGLVRNCLILSNTAEAGGGVYCSNSVLQNCTIVTNSAILGGGVFRKNRGTVENSIVLANTAWEAGDNWYNSGSDTGTYRYSCTTPPVDGEGNLTAGPLFVAPATGNWRLSLGSPCINRGTNTVGLTGLKDLDGYDRVMNGAVDIGCFEYPYYSITAEAGPNGTIAPSGTVYVPKGGGTNFLMTPAPLYHILDLQVDGSSDGWYWPNGYTFVNVTTAHSLNVVFTPTPNKLAIEPTTNSLIVSWLRVQHNTDTNVFTLQMTTNLLSSWTDVQVFTNNGPGSWTNRLNRGPQEFYRLFIE